MTLQIFIKTTCKQNKLSEGSGVPITQSQRNNGKYEIIMKSLKITVKDWKLTVGF